MVDKVKYKRHRVRSVTKNIPNCCVVNVIRGLSLKPTPVKYMVFIEFKSSNLNRVVPNVGHFNNP